VELEGGDGDGADDFAEGFDVVLRELAGEEDGEVELVLGHDAQGEALAEGLGLLREVAAHGGGDVDGYEAAHVAMVGGGCFP
jgi:hypothetical protein